ncbi:hypothetical protein [Sphingomonas adhaesiva]|uniref:hypothetical protein n=1 Tax=Sphingomonas adhaesiva TaxID=28212 RepID=UPI002FF76EEE
MRGASTLWIMLLTLASTVTTLLLACATPFTALAALAATQMRLRDGVALTLAAWVASQAVGFCVLDYPRDAGTIGWAAALAVAAVAATVVAHRLDRPGRGTAVRLALAYLVAAIVFKAVILAASFALGGVDVALSTAINARQLVRNGAILAGLYALYRGLRVLGVPPAPLPAPAC